MDDWFGLQRGLVAVGLLAVVPGCPADDKDKTTESTGTDPGSTGATDGDGTGTGTTDGTTGDPPTGTGSGSATDSGTGTTGEPTTGGTSTTTDATTSTSTSTTDTTGGIDIPPVCQSYGAKFAECYMDPAVAMEAVSYCADRHMMAQAIGADCVQAYEAYMACLSALPCAEFLDDVEDCLAEFDAGFAACN
jgi:hypothetical protein